MAHKKMSKTGYLAARPPEEKLGGQQKGKTTPKVGSRTEVEINNSVT